MKLFCRNCFLGSTAAKLFLKLFLKLSHTLDSAGFDVHSSALVEGLRRNYLIMEIWF